MQSATISPWRPSRRSGCPEGNTNKHKACGFLSKGSCESFSQTAGGPICPLACPAMAGQISGHYGPDRYPSAPTRTHTHTGSPGAARSRGLTARHSRLSMGSARGGEERPEGGAGGLEVAVIAAKARLTANMGRERKQERATEEERNRKHSV
ncbi:unnamed protein product [Leuciscus chuanchicus]